MKWVLVIILAVVVGYAGYVLYDSPQSSREIVSITPSADQKTIDINTLTPEILAEGLTKPWDVVILPDTTILITEDEGIISRIKNGVKTVALDIESVNAIGEGGLMGVTQDGDFLNNPYIYACYATNTDIRVSRWRWQGDNLQDRRDIVTGIPVNRSSYNGRHSGCRPRFGPDNNLWIGTGDVAIGTHPQDLRSLGGKVLRVDREGNAASDNPGGNLDPRIYSYGHRNIQGLAFARNGEPFIGVSVEHGPGTDDEVNELILGGNFGWNPVPGYNESVPMTDTAEFPDAVAALWSSGSPTLAPSGATFVYGENWGQYDGVLFVAMLKAKHIRLLSFSAQGALQGEEEWLKDVYGRIRSVVQGPDGSLYFTTDNGNGQDVLGRVTPQ